MHNLEVWGLLKQIVNVDIVSEIIKHKIKVAKLKINCYGDTKSYVINDVGYIWGTNDCGQLGLNHLYNVAYPTKVLIDDIKSIKHGTKFTYILTNSGQLYRCGDYNYESSFFNQSKLSWVMNGIRKVNISCGPTTLITFNNHVSYQDYSDRGFYNIKKVDYNYKLFNSGILFYRDKILADNVKSFDSYMINSLTYLTNDFNLVSENFKFKAKKFCFRHGLYYIGLDGHLYHDGVRYNIKVKDVKYFESGLLVRDVYGRVGIYDGGKFVEANHKNYNIFRYVWLFSFVNWIINFI